MKYNKELLSRFINEKVAIVTRTQEEYDDFMKLLEKETDLMRVIIHSPTKNKCLWFHNEDETVVACGFFNKGEVGFGSKEFYKEHGYKIIEYKDLIKGEKGMKTKEFIKRVEALGYEIDNTLGRDIDVMLKGETLASVSEEASNRLDTIWYAEITQELFDLLVIYASTPIDERGEQPKYYWKIKGLGSLRGENHIYLNYVDGERPKINTKVEIGTYQTQFTEKEFKEICEKHNITAEFEKEEKRYKVRCKLTNRYLDKTFNGKLDWNSMRASQRIFTLKELEELGIDVEHYDLEEIE